MKNSFNRLFTEESRNVGEIPWNVYPRPLLRRDSFLCLNGTWELEISESGDMPSAFSGKILVPFAPQSALSGVEETIPDGSYLFYRRKFSLDENFINERVILHFGACDQKTSVFLNDTLVCEHKGGYDPFSVDVTNVLSDENTLVVRVFDELASHVMPYGKQTQKRGGMWYTAVSGIWQTVWLESVPEKHVERIKTSTFENEVVIDVFDESLSGSVTVNCADGERTFELIDGVCRFKLEKPRLWSCDDPFLYHFTLRTEKDTVSSYFAIRELEIKEKDGVWRLCVNGNPVFFNGILDQGYFCDGIFTPATPESYTNEITRLKQMGFNTLRKHIKTEPQLFYFECDRLGMFVFQDMVNNGKYSFLKDTAFPTVFSKYKNDKNMHKNEESRSAFKEAMETTVRQLDAHPCIVLWTIFNEGWGQFCSSEMYGLLKKLDPTRFIDSASGWFKGGESDVVSDHVYFKPYKFKKAQKPVVLSEFGGYTYSCEGHIFNPDKSYGYKTFKSREALEKAYKELYERDVIPYVKHGLCASVYTQVSDVEDEINGIFTYDRRVQKISTKTLKEIAESLKIEN